MTNEQMIQEAQQRATELYRNGDFLCSEAVLLTINELMNYPLPGDIVKLASGFPVGMGQAGCVCGAISGGVMALGLVFGRTKPGEKCPKIFPATKELHDWFKAKRRSTCCRVLIKDLKYGSPEHIQQCIDITGEVAGKTIELILKYQEMGTVKLLLNRLKK